MVISKKELFGLWLLITLCGIIHLWRPFGQQYYNWLYLVPMCVSWSYLYHTINIFLIFQWCDEQAGAELGQAQPQLGLRVTNAEIWHCNGSSRLWYRFIILIKSHHCYKNSSLWLNLIIVMKIYDLDESSSFCWNSSLR